MRRSERQVTDLLEINDMIGACEVIRLGMIDEGKPYIVPLNFGYKLSDQGVFSFYFHSANTGRKINILKRNPQVFFEMDRLISLGKNEIACKWTAYYESIMGEGLITFLTEAEEKESALTLIMEKHGFDGLPEFSQPLLERIQVYRLDVTELSAKRNLPPE